MNKPNPLVPQGTFADKGKSHIRLTVFAILAVHVVLLCVLLIAGCNKGKENAQGDPGLPPAVTPLVNDTTNPPPWPGQPSHIAPTSMPVVVAQPSNPPPSIPAEPLPPPTSGATEHAVVKGDNFYTLGKQYKVGSKAIADANPGVDSSRLKIGQKLKIPAPRPTPSGPVIAGGSEPGPGNGSGEKVYSVKSGDSLIKIAKSYGITPKELQAANELHTTKIRVGQKLKIPGKTPVVPPDAAGPPPALPAPEAAATPGTFPR